MYSHEKNMYPICIPMYPICFRAGNVDYTEGRTQTSQPVSEESTLACKRQWTLPPARPKTIYVAKFNV